MEAKCLGKGDQTEACTKGVKDALRSDELPNLKSSFIDYLDFQSKQL